MLRIVHNFVSTILYTLFHNVFNFLIMKYSSFSSSVILLSFSSSALFKLALFLCFCVSTCAFHLHFWLYIYTPHNLSQFHYAPFLFAFIFSEFASLYFFSLSRNLSGSLSLSCFRLSFLRLNPSMYVLCILVWQVSHLPVSSIVSFNFQQDLQVLPASMFLLSIKLSTF